MVPTTIVDLPGAFVACRSPPSVMFRLPSDRPSPPSFTSLPRRTRAFGTVTCTSTAIASRIDGPAGDAADAAGVAGGFAVATAGAGGRPAVVAAAGVGLVAAGDGATSMTAPF